MSLALPPPPPNPSMRRVVLDWIQSPKSEFSTCQTEQMLMTSTGPQRNGRVFNYTIQNRVCVPPPLVVSANQILFNWMLLVQGNFGKIQVPRPLPL